MWTLLIIAVLSATLTSSVQITSLPMQNRVACVAAAESFAKESKGIGFVCVSSETGEVVKFTK